MIEVHASHGCLRLALAKVILTGVAFGLGSGAVLGDFKSQVSAIGPQIGYIFPFYGEEAYFNLKGYCEFGAKHRAEGWNLWLTLPVPLGAEER